MMISKLREVPERTSKYCAATSGKAWAAYDIDPNPGLLTTPALLSYGGTRQHLLMHRHLGVFVDNVGLEVKVYS